MYSIVYIIVHAQYMYMYIYDMLSATVHYYMHMYIVLDLHIIVKGY